MHNNIRIPPFWGRIGWTQKAAYLLSSGQARDYPHACSILAKRKRRKVTPSAPVVARLPYADS